MSHVDEDAEQVDLPGFENTLVLCVAADVWDKAAVAEIADSISWYLEEVGYLENCFSLVGSGVRIIHKPIILCA